MRVLRFLWVWLLRPILTTTAGVLLLPLIPVMLGIEYTVEAWVESGR